MKPLKFICFFLAGAIIQTAFYFLGYLGFFGGWGGVVTAVLFSVFLGLGLGFSARNLAVKKMKMPPFPLVMTYVAGTVAVIAAIRILTEINNPHCPDNTGLGNLPNLGRNIALFIWLLTIPSAAINAIIQVIIGIRDKIKMNKEKNR